MSTKFTEADLEDLKSRNIRPGQMDDYKADLINGFPFVKLQSNALLGREIQTYDPDEIDLKCKHYENRQNLAVVKFVPASGAASRMFKDLFAALNSEELNDSANQFFRDLELFAFSDKLLDKSGIEKKENYSVQEKRKILATLLLPDGLNYGQLPQGSIEFHSYKNNKNRTAFEEHFYEAKSYATQNGMGFIHFTLPAEQKAELDTYLDGVKDVLSAELEINFEVQTSIQKPETDTPAIYIDNQDWARLEDGSLLFRPAGHGALLENLNDIDADLIFVKNIDNVVPDRSKAETARYKKLLAGVLLEFQDRVFEFLRDSESGCFDSETARKFLSESFFVDTTSLSDDDLIGLLNRPIRVCGMVKNEGEPGGGPFIVEDEGKKSLQIVEKAQIDLGSESQNSLLKTASHFNPVDLVLGVKNYKAQKFDLLKYRNAKTGMRVEKTLRGKPIYALELPGLWNGSMYDWNTVFVEVPIETFNPVKTVLDLVRPAHLS